MWTKSEIHLSAYQDFVFFFVFFYEYIFYFSLLQAIFDRAVGKERLRQLIIDNPQAKRVLKMILALPLLDADLIQGGLDIIREHATEHQIMDRFTNLCNHVANYWIDEVGVEVLSIGALDSRTNNLVENFYHYFMKKLQFELYPPFWKFLGKCWFYLAIDLLN